MIWVRDIALDKIKELYGMCYRIAEIEMCLKIILSGKK